MEVDKTHPEAGFVELEPLVIGGIDFVWVIIALVCVLVSFGFWVIATILDDLFGSFSIFGFHPFGFARGLLSGVMKKEWSWMEGKLGSFTNWLYSQAAVVWRFMYVAVVSIVGLWEQVLGFQQRNTNDLSSEAVRAQAAEQQLQQELSQDVTAIGQEQGYLEGQIATLETDTLPTIEDQIALLQAQIQNLANINLATLEADIRNGLAGVESDLQNAESTINATINRDVSDLTQQLAQATNTLQNEITTNLSTAESFATGAAAGAEAGAVAQAIAQLQPQINAITTETTECLDPLCDTVTPNARQLGNLGKLLKDLEGLFAAGALMALLVAAVEDPKGTATVVVDTMGWVTPLSVDLVDVVGNAAGVEL